MDIKKAAYWIIGAVLAVVVGLFILSRIAAVRDYLGLGTPKAIKPA